MELETNTKVVVRSNKDPNTAGGGNLNIKRAIGPTSPMDTWHLTAKAERKEDHNMVAKRANTGRNLTGYCFHSL